MVCPSVSPLGNQRPPGGSGTGRRPGVLLKAKCHGTAPFTGSWALYRRGPPQPGRLGTSVQAQFGWGSFFTQPGVRHSSKGGRLGKWGAEALLGRSPWEGGGGSVVVQPALVWPNRSRVTVTWGF